MKQNAVPAVSATRVYKEVLRILTIVCLLACILFASCGTSRRGVKGQSADVAVELTPEQQRKYDYFFLEAARLKIQKEYAAAFNLLQHCLTINPNASSAL